MQSSYDILGQAISSACLPSQAEYSSSALWHNPEHTSSMPGAHGGLKAWPSTSKRPSRDTPSRTSSRSQLREQDSSATLRSHYDARTQPLTISQQTSMSSVRDMALRKGTPAVLQKKDKSNDSRPLKSALKRYPSVKQENAHPQFLYPPEQEQSQPKPKQSRFSRLSAFFTRRSPSRSSSQISRTPSLASTISTHYAAQDTGPRRKRSIGWDQPLHQYGGGRSDSAQSGRLDTVREAKLASGDVFEAAKMHIRRPPKGIKNWFEAETISSDDDVPPVEMSAQEALPSTFTTFLPEPGQRSQFDTQDGRHERTVGRPTTARRDQFEDDLIDRATTPKASAQRPKSQHGRRQNESSMSTRSSTDGGETDISGRDSSLDLYGLENHYSHANKDYRPSIPPRKLQSSQIAQHNAYHVNDRPRLLTRNSDTVDDEYAERPTTASRRTPQKSQSTPRSRGRASTHMSSGYDDSSGGVPVDPDIAHMMAVTEEEMALLEMMREKRAAMQKSSYSEGYRQALKREHEQLMQRRMLAQQTALRILRSQHDLDAVRRQPAFDDQDVEDREIRQLNKLRQQEMDRMKRLEKFLAMDASMAAALDEPELSQTDEPSHWPLTKQDSGRLSDLEVREGRRKAGTPSFSRRDAYGDRRSRSRHGDDDDANLALTFPVPPMPADWRFEQDFKHDSTGKKTRQFTQEGAYTHEVYTMKHSAVRSTIPPQARQHIQASTFLRSISDYQPAEDKSIISSADASTIPPRTPSSMDEHGGRTTRYVDVPSRESNYTDRVSPEASFASRTGTIRKSKNAAPLAIMSEPHRSGQSTKNDSVSDDVLAAWASLGGHEGMLHSRRSRAA